MNGKAQQRTPFHFMWVPSKGLGFGRVILKWDNDAGTKSPEDEVIRACASGSDSTEPPEGDHIPNGRVEMEVREVKRQCRPLRISGE